MKTAIIDRHPITALAAMACARIPLSCPLRCLRRTDQGGIGRGEAALTDAALEMYRSEARRLTLAISGVAGSIPACFSRSYDAQWVKVEHRFEPAELDRTQWNVCSIRKMCGEQVCCRIDKPFCMVRRDPAKRVAQGDMKPILGEVGSVESGHGLQLFPHCPQGRCAFDVCRIHKDGTGMV